MNKCKRMGLWTSITCGFLAGIMGFTGPQEIKAAAQGAYLSDVIVITDEDVAKAKKDGYTVMSSPLGEQTLRDQKYGENHTKTYLAYKTTSKVNDAIRDMKFMNMNGGFDFAKYDEYLDDLEIHTKQTTNTLFEAIEGYRKYYKAGTPEGKYAHDALNIFVYDSNDGFDSSVLNNSLIKDTLVKDNLSENDINEPIRKRLGDLFLDEDLIPNGNSEILTEIFMESNASALDVIYSALNVANQYDDEGKNVLDKLEEVKDNYSQFADRTDLNAVFEVFDADFYRMRDDINWYNTSAVCKYTDFKDTDEALAYSLKLLDDDIVNETTYANAWCNAAKEIPFLENIEYKGLSGKYNNLLELIMDEEAEAQEYYPLLACMTPGVRGTAHIGIMQTLTNSMLDRDKYLERLNALKNIDEDAHQIVEVDGISVFYGVDRSLFQKGNVAMTTSAEEGAIKGDNEWMKAEARRKELNENTTDILKFVTVGLEGLVVSEGIGFIIARGVYSSALEAATRTSDLALSNVELYNAMQIKTGTWAGVKVSEVNGGVMYKNVLKTASKSVGTPEGTAAYEAEAQTLKNVVAENETLMNLRAAANGRYERALASESALKNTLASIKVAMAISITIAVVALVVTLVFFLINLLEEDKPTFTKYTDVPGILCHYQSVFDVYDNGTRSPASKKGYVYYYGATNPYGVASKAKYGNDDDGTLELGENKRNVQDIFNWELGAGKSREWVCLYYTKDIKANYPITTSSLKVLAEVGETLAGASYFNNPNIEYNMTSVLVNNYFDDENIKTDDIMNIQPKYLRFDVNKRGDLKNQRSSVASIVSNPAAWGFILLGLALGFGGGFLTFHLIDKKKKKANA